VGWLSIALELILERIEANTPAEAFRDLEAQIQRLPRRGLGRTLFNTSGKHAAMRELDARLVDEVVFNYLGRVESVTQTDGLLQLAPESFGPQFAPENHRATLLDCTAMLKEDRLVVTWTYSFHLYRHATIEWLAEQFLTNLRWLIAPDTNGGA
jgi:non-ribosomal peptide synthase protein (TIGR01720 family)